MPDTDRATVFNTSLLRPLKDLAQLSVNPCCRPQLTLIQLAAEMVPCDSEWESRYKKSQPLRNRAG